MSQDDVLENLHLWLVHGWNIATNFEAWDWLSVAIRFVFAVVIILLALWIVPFTRNLGNRFAYLLGHRGVMFIFYFFVRLLRSHLIVMMHLVKPRDEIFKCLKLDLMRQEEDKFKKSKKVYF